jgi:hypothetical protein
MEFPGGLCYYSLHPGESWKYERSRSQPANVHRQ